MILTRYTLERVYLSKVTPGSLFAGRTRIESQIIAKTLELPYRNNAVSTDPELASCVMEGIYLVVQEPPKQSRPYPYYRIVHAPGRNWDPFTKMSNILIHPVNYVKDLLGCIAPGSRHADLNADGIIDLVDSKKKLAWMIQNMPPQFELEIRKKP
jgi:hypothetical protein